MSIFEENWDIFLNLDIIEENSFEEFEIKMECVHEQVMSLIENDFKVNKYNCSTRNMDQDYDDELKSLMERNQQLRLDIDKKLEELSQQTKQYETYKKDQKLLSQEIKETHEAFLMAKKYYKKFLKMYYMIESKTGQTQTIFIQFFTESKKESEYYSVRLLKDTKMGCYQLLNVTPKLHMVKEFQKRLQETNDVPGVLCCLRQAFTNLKMKKKH